MTGFIGVGQLKYILTNLGEKMTEDEVDELLKAKLRGTGLEPYVDVVARIDTEAEKRLVPIYRLEP